MPSCAPRAREGEAEEVREATGIVQTREERKKKYSWLGTVAAILGAGAEGGGGSDNTEEEVARLFPCGIAAVPRRPIAVAE